MSQFVKSYAWQEAAVDHFIEHGRNYYHQERGKFERACVVQVTPSGGKTVFSMKAARAMIGLGLIDKAIFIVPRNSIKPGFEDDAKLVELPPEKRLLGCEYMRIDTDLKSNYNSLLRNHHGVVVTYHALPGLMGLFRLWSDARQRLMFVFDEAHHGASNEDDGDDDDATASVWGDAMTEVGEIANCIIAMTGTPVRTDGRDVPHFRYEEKKATDPKTSEIIDARFVLSDFAFSYRDGVSAGVARKLIIRNQDATITADIDGEEVVEKLSAMVAKRADKAKRLLESLDSGHIDQMLRVAKEENDRHRHIGDHDAAVLVVVGSGGKGKRNPLEHVAERARLIFGEEPVSIESSDGTSDQNRDVIKKFKRGTGRIIIAKNMISEGTSIPRIRCVCILRDIKSQVFYEQLVHRATRNDSDEVAQDAIVIQWNLRNTLYVFGEKIENETRMVVIKPKPICPECGEEVEYRVTSNDPCPACGHIPSPGTSPPSSGDDYLPLFAEMTGELVTQGGEDFSTIDPTGRAILDKLGPNPRYGGRDGINEILRMGCQTLNVIQIVSSAPAVPAPPLFNIDEQMDRCWDLGNKYCKTSAGIVSRKTGRPYSEVLREIISACKRQAGFGPYTIEKVKREFKDPLAALQKFLHATEAVLARVKSGEAA